MTTPHRAWSGRAVTEARAWVAANWLPMPCGAERCVIGGPVDGSKPWVIGHVKSRAEHPELIWEVGNWRVEHRACSNASAQGVVIAKAKAEGRREAASSSLDSTPWQPPPLPVSPPEPLSQPALTGLSLPMPTGEPTATRPDLAWPGESLKLVPWLAEYAEVPDDAAPPLYMSPVPEDAVCSYAWSGCTHLPEGEPDVLTWIETEQVVVPGRSVRLRWWQRLSLAREHEHREDGSLCHREVIGSAPRRAGKSVRMRGKALWRMHARFLFGEPQLVMHTGSDMAICREVQRGAWRWAISRWGKDAVTSGNGKESIETPAGDRWLVRSQDGVYGYDVTLALGDECWNVKPETINEGLEPATLERVMPQLDLTSTAHRRATSLMRGKISTAMAVADPEALLLVWAAPPGSDPSDPAVWRAASPHWTEERRKLIRAKYEAALAGQADPQADDPDPIAGFTSQYLNVWRLNERSSRGEPITDAETWDALTAAPTGPIKAVAVEAWFSGGVSVARAWQVDGRAVVAASEHRTVDEAAQAIRATGYRGWIDAGKSLVEHPAFRGMRVKAQSTRSAEAVVRLGGLLRDDTLRHDGGLHLSAQATEVRTTTSTDGPRVVSGTRTDAIKAAVWAAARAAAAPTNRPAMPSRARRHADTR